MGRSPLLSVVVPFYNAAPWFRPWVRSLRRQTMADFECVVVDDGSTDGSADLLRQAVLDDPRFRILSQPNSGPAAARNTGIALARAPYLTFCDPDDLVPPDAYARLMGRITQDGTDLASGAVQRLRGQISSPSIMHRGLHDVARVLTPGELGEQVLYDQLSVNKIFRTDFFRAAVGGFPDQRKYEDILPMTTALLAAGSISIEAAPVYQWRRRGDGSSLTQTLDNAALEMRLAALRACWRLVCRARPDLRAAMAVKMLRHDISVHLVPALAADQAQRTALGQRISRFIDRNAIAAHLPEALTDLVPRLRQGQIARSLQLLRAHEKAAPPGLG